MEYSVISAVFITFVLGVVKFAIVATLFMLVFTLLVRVFTPSRWLK